MSIASFFKRAADSSQGGTKRAREDDDASTSASEPKSQVRTLAVWNANSLVNRVQHDRPALARFLREHSPDVIFVSEVRSPALGPVGCKRGDGQPRQQGKFSRATSALAGEADAVARFVKEFGYRAYWSLADYKYAGAGLLVKASCEQPHALRFSLDRDAAASAHHREGRVILASFAQFDVLGTYSPNNGGSEESFARRRLWDAECGALLRRARGPPLVWLGDLNVAAEWGDVGPDPNWFRNQNGRDAANVDDRGQPGFTANEQARFRALLAEGGLVDAYRVLHPTANWMKDVTWRGSPGKEGPPESGRYYAKGMRIDYVLVDRQLVSRVVRSEVLGSGAERHGFLGSDHCPLLVELAPAAVAEGGGSSSTVEGNGGVGPCPALPDAAGDVAASEDASA